MTEQSFDQVENRNDNQRLAITETKGLTPASLEALRQHFADEIRFAHRVSNACIIDAFARVPREAFLGPGPWLIYHPESGYFETPDADPRHLYHDVRIAIDHKRKLNNGSPALTASIMEFARPREGENVLHIGCGTGYFTAVWAEIVGPSGRVTGIEIDEILAAAAKSNLEGYSNVDVVHGDGTELISSQWDIIVFSAGTNRLRASWIRSLAEHGRLVIPFTLGDKNGRVLRATREAKGFGAAFMPGQPITYYELLGNRNAAIDLMVAASLAQWGWKIDGSIHFGCSKPCDDCWLNIPEEKLCISVRPLGG